jgi:fucose 4-O-acetylase-like acetyltransferase
MTTTLDARTLAASTPDTRDRYVDLLRLASIAVVVLGHWMMADLVTDADGGVHAGNSLATMPYLQPLTWVLQVVPLFFFCGGIAHAHVLRKADGYTTFLTGRARRLLAPMCAFVACWAALAVALEIGGLDGGAMAVALRVVTQPLWFLGVYLGVIVLAPAMHRLHDRHGWRAILAMGVGIALTDALRFSTGITAIGAVNVGLVWLAVHQLGFAYADGSLDRGRALVLAIGGSVAMAALLILGPYPVSMVGMPGEAISNMSPPTAALAAQATWLVGLAVLARPALSRWLQRPRVWLVVVAGNGVIMSLFLWHLTGFFVVELGLRAVGATPPAAGSSAWWGALPLRMLASALVTACLIATFRRFERPSPVRVVRATRVVASGAVCALLGILCLSASGLGGMLTGRTGDLLGVPITAIEGLILLGIGALMIDIRATTVRPWSTTG